MDFYIVLHRTGERVGQRKKQRSTIGKHQKVTKEDAQQWFIEKLGGTLLN
jgi:hypothetical protein